MYVKYFCQIHVYNLIKSKQEYTLKLTLLIKIHINNKYKYLENITDCQHQTLAIQFDIRNQLDHILVV